MRSNFRTASYCLITHEFNLFSVLSLFKRKFDYVRCQQAPAIAVHLVCELFLAQRRKALRIFWTPSWSFIPAGRLPDIETPLALIGKSGTGTTALNSLNLAYTSDNLLKQLWSFIPAAITTARFEMKCTSYHSFDFKLANLLPLICCSS